MKIYVLEREDWDYDDTIGFVIVAASEHAAREVAHRAAHVDGYDSVLGTWRESSLSTCECIGSGRGPERIALESVRHG